MPASTTARRLLLLAAVGIVALFIAGFITGAIGSAFFGTSQLLPEPEVHLPAQQVVGSAPEGAEGEVLPRKFVITNTLLSSWLATLLLLGLFFLATRRMSLVPRGLQNLMEALVEALYAFVQSVAGPENARRFLPVIATIFLFVAFNAWLGLLPFYQSLVFQDEEGHITRHLLRPAGTDLNMPLALALVSLVFVEFWGFRVLGRGYLKKFFPFGNLLHGRIFQGLIDLFVGFLEALSELVRIISFTFRLFGNMTAGEILLLISTFLVPFIFSIPFYGLEILVGFVQALIFAGLTLVFVVVAVTPHSAENHVESSAGGR